MYQCGLRIALGTLTEFLCCLNLPACQLIAFFCLWKNASELFIVLVVVDRLFIYLDETVEGDHFALGDKLFFGGVHLDGNRCLLNICVGHLTGDGTFPDEVVETFLLCGAFYLYLVHIGRTDGLVGFLGTFRMGLVMTRLAVLLAIETVDFCLAGIDAEIRQVDGVGTHIGDTSVLIQSLGDHHRLTDGEAQLTGSLLLQGRCGKGRCWCTLHRLFLDAVHRECGVLAFLQEGLCLLCGLETGTQGGFDLRSRTVGVGDGKDTIHTIIGLALEILDLALTLHNQTDGNTLYTSCRQGGLDLAPQYGRQLEAYQTV